PRTHIYRAELGRLAHQRHQIDRCCHPVEQTYKHHRAAHSDRRNRIFQSSYRIYHAVRADPAGQLHHCRWPVGRGCGVDAISGTQHLCALKLVVAARGDDHTRAAQPRELKRKHGDAAGSSYHHGVAWRYRWKGIDSSPCRNTGTWERRRFLIRQVRWHMHKAGFMHEGVFGQNAVCRCAAQRLPHLRRSGPALQPMRIEDRRNAIAHLHARDVIAEGGNNPNAVRERYTWEWWPPAPHAVDHQQVAIVDRKGLHLQDNLPWPRNRVRALRTTERVYAEPITQFDHVHTLSSVLVDTSGLYHDMTAVVISTRGLLTSRAQAMPHTQFAFARYAAKRAVRTSPTSRPATACRVQGAPACAPRRSRAAIG